jgi:hypothetical protein
VRIAIIALLGFAAGCESREDAEYAAHVEDVEARLPKVRAAIASGQRDLDTPCAGLRRDTHYLDTSTHAALVTEIRRICEYELNLARMKRAVETSEAARKAHPDERVLPECYTAELAIALRHIRKAKLFDAAAQVLVTRFEAVCPGVPTKIDEP